MKTIHLNSKDGTAREVDLDFSGPDGYKRISETIGCEFFTAIALRKNEDGTSETAYCDDVGAINGTKNGLMHFLYGPIFGDVLIVGTNQMGESIDTKVDINDLLDIGITHKFDIIVGEIDKPGFELKKLEIK